MDLDDFIKSFQVIYTVVAVLSIASSVFTSFVILKYEKLRKDITNILLLHMNIVEVLFLSLTAISSSVRANAVVSRSETIFCAVHELEVMLVACIFLLLIVITIDWYVKTYSERRNTRFQRTCTYFSLTVLYALVVVVTCFLCHFCITTPNIFVASVMGIVFLSLVVVIFAIVMNIIHRVMLMRTADRARDNIGLAITNVFLLAWVTVYVPLLMVVITGDMSDPSFGLMMMAVLTCVAIPIYNLVYLCRCSTFNVFLKRTFRCDCNDNRHEPLGDPSIAFNNANGVLLPQQ